MYRQYLTVPEFAQRFGATAQQVAAVRSALRAQGLSVGAVTANQLTIPVTGTAIEVQRAFSVSLAQVKLADGRTAYANREAPTLASSIAGYVQGVIGLDDLTPAQPAGLAPAGRASASLTHRHPHALARIRSGFSGPGPTPSQSAGNATADVVTGGPQPCLAAQNEQTSYDNLIAGQFGVQAFPATADQIASAYRFSSFYQSGDLGAGQTIALFEEQAFDPTDIAVYQGCYGTSVPITPVNIDGGPGPCTSPGGGQPCDGESALDIEQVIGLAPQANVLVYQGPTNGTGVIDILSAIVSQDAAQVISSSFGGCEALTGVSVITAENTLLQEAAAQGQSFFASSGDSGAEQCSQAGQGDFSLSVEDPSAQPFATGVGGTSLTAYGPPPTEAVWNDGPNPECNCTSGSLGGGSGGGLSSHWPMPAYQSGAPATLAVTNPNSSATPCGGTALCREVPDVSADADALTGYVGFSGGQWEVTGGTSASAPLWAAYIALVNGSGPCRGLPVGFVNPALYTIAGGGLQSNFNDITAASPYTGAAGNDTLTQFGVGSSDPRALYPVGPNYDMSTGLGSMNGPALGASLCGVRAPTYAISVANPGAQSTTVGHGVSLAVTASDSGGVPVVYGASNLPAGLSINAGNGVITGTPTTAQTTSVTVSATDAFKNAGATTFTWAIVNPAPVVVAGRAKFSRAKFAGLTSRKPRLMFTVTAGANAPALASVSVSLPRGMSFARKSKSLLKGISVKSGGRRVKFKARARHGRLTISFTAAEGTANVTIGKPSISISGGLKSKVRRHKVKKVSVGLRATDTSHHTINVSARLKV